MGALSNGKVVETLNKYYIPVFAVNEDYENGTVPPDEKKERDRIWGEASEQKRSWGMVCAYLLEPKEGHLIETGLVPKYTTVEGLLPLLEKVIQQLKLQPGKTIVPPVPQSTPLRKEPGGLVLNLTARYVDAEGNIEALNRRGTYHELPGESFVSLTRAEREKLLPPADTKVGAKWDVDADVAKKVLYWFYPVLEDNANISVEEAGWKARVLSTQGGMIRVRFDGSATVKHLSFYNRQNFSLHKSTFIGYVDYDSREKRVKALEMATDQARHSDGQTFAVAVHAVPEAK